ncbi:MAG: HU family DNA-binding protein [Planctomycetota bacterium]
MARKTAKKTKKKAAKKTAKRTAKRVAKKAPARTGGRIVGAKGKARTKSEVLTVLSDQTGVPKRDVAQIFEVMHQMIAADLKKGNIGAFNVPGLMKVVVQRKPATKARKGINPFTKEETIFKAKPARNVVKIRPLKALKDSV